MIKTNKIQAKMIENGYTIKDIATELNIAPTSYFNKIHGTFEFKASEIANISKLLKLNAEEIDDIFFTEDSD